MVLVAKSIVKNGQLKRIIKNCLTKRECQRVFIHQLKDKKMEELKALKDKLSKLMEIKNPYLQLKITIHNLQLMISERENKIK